MTPKQREAMQLALDALENCSIEYDFHGNPYSESDREIINAIGTLREALAEPDVHEGWLRAIDEALVSVNLGVANAEDDYATAKKKLFDLIEWKIYVDRISYVQLHPDEYAQILDGR